MKIEELRQQIETKTIEVRGFLEKMILKMPKSYGRIKRIKRFFKDSRKIRTGGKRSTRETKNKEKRGNKSMEKANEYRAVVKKLWDKN